MRTLVATDLDGTILESDGGVPRAGLTCLVAQIRSLGVDFCVATSRSVPNVQALGLEPSWIVAHDGACIMEQEDNGLGCVRELLLSEADAGSAVDVAVGLAGASDRRLLASVFHGVDLDFRVAALSSPAGVASEILEAFSALVDDGRRLVWSSRNWTEGAASVRAVSLFGDSVAIADAAGAFNPAGGVAVHEYPETRGWPGLAWLDIQVAGVDKGLAVDLLRKRQAFDRVIAFGNGPNDVRMLESASFSIAPSDASAEAKAAASAVLDVPCGEGAFTDAIVRYLPDMVSAPERIEVS